jgi:Spy/CpxP family protein refolding chaperone
MKKLYTGMLVVLFVALAASVFAFGPPFAEGRPPFAGPSGEFRGPANFPGSFGPGAVGRPGFAPGARAGFNGPNYLNLSKEQIDKMQELRGRNYAETRDLRYELSQKQLDMRKLFTDPKAEDATILAKQKELSSLRQKLMDKMAQIPIEMRKVLTPEQLQKLDQLLAGHFGMGMGGFGGMGPGMMGRMMPGFGG